MIPSSVNQQRHFFHARVTHSGGVLALPIVLILHPGDEAALNADLQRVQDDVLFILSLHGKAILPQSGSAVVGSAPADLRHQSFFGHFISASFELRFSEESVGIITFSMADAAAGGSGEEGGAGTGADDAEDDGLAFADIPVSSYSLICYVKHKLGEVRRRADKLLADPVLLEAYRAARDGGSGATGKQSAAKSAK